MKCCFFFSSFQKSISFCDCYARCDYSCLKLTLSDKQKWHSHLKYFFDALFWFHVRFCPSRPHIFNSNVAVKVPFFYYLNTSASTVVYNFCWFVHSKTLQNKRRQQRRHAGVVCAPLRKKKKNRVVMWCKKKTRQRRRWKLLLCKGGNSRRPLWYA